MMTPRRIFIFCAFFSLSYADTESSASDPGVVSAPSKRQNIPGFSPEEIKEALKEGQDKMAAWLGDRSAETVLVVEGPRLRVRYAGTSERERLVIGAMFSTLTQKLQESFPDPKAASSEGLLSPTKGSRLFLESSPGAANLDLLLLEGAALDTSAQMFLNLLYVHGYRQPEGDWILPPHDPRIRELWEMLADEGMSRGLLNLGNAYLHGQGVEPDIEKGLDFLERSHLEEGWMALAMHYYQQQDLIQARAWWRYAALETDSAEAWYNTGVGEMEMRQYGEALKAFTRCLEVNPVFYAAKIEMARLYMEGWGVEVDLDRAEALLREVLATGREHLHYHAYADVNLGELTRRKKLPGIEANRVRFSHLRRQAAKNDPEAMREFAGMLLGGFAGIEARPMVAVEWLERAASLGDVAAMRELGIIRVKGIEDVLEAEPARGVHLLTAAAEAGDADAQFRMGSLYFEGKDVQEDTEKAQALYRASAAQGFPEAMLYLGMRLWEGRGMAKDVKEAHIWLKRCAEIGMKEGLLLYSLFLAQQDVAERTSYQVYVWSTLAIRSGVFDLKDMRDDRAMQLTEEEWKRAREEVERRFKCCS